MEVLDFFPVFEKKNLGKLSKHDIKDTIFGSNNMLNIKNNNLSVENNFPWSLPQEYINEILQPYLSKEFVSIIEVGTHIGTTATRFANTVKHNPKSYVLCIDTWLGDVAEYLLRINQIKPHFKPGNDFFLFELFIQNIQNNNLEDVIIPFRLPSIQAGQILYYYGIQVDIIYIDASHEYLNVKHDINLYWNLLTDDGIIFGDDYQIDGVKKAIDEFVKTNHLELTIRDGIFRDNIQQLTWLLKKTI
jgi:predicted O-methyltransferase YrrM